MKPNLSWWGGGRHGGSLLEDYFTTPFWGGGLTILAASQTHSPLIHFLFVVVVLQTFSIFSLFWLSRRFAISESGGFISSAGKRQWRKNLCLMIKILDLFFWSLFNIQALWKEKKGSNILTYQVLFSSVWNVTPRIFGTPTYYCIVALSTSFKSIHSNHYLLGEELRLLSLSCFSWTSSVSGEMPRHSPAKSYLKRRCSVIATGFVVLVVCVSWYLGSKSESQEITGGWASCILFVWHRQVHFLRRSEAEAIMRALIIFMLGPIQSVAAILAPLVTL